MKKEANPPSLMQVSLILSAIMLLGLYLRIPFLDNGLPYLYDEDEAHHVNRVIEMAKNKDLNPRYFHKPSLHFYLRLPAVALSIEIEKLRGKIQSAQDVRTRDNFGIADYAFSTSNSLIIVAARSISLIASLGIIILSYLTAKLLLLSRRAALLSALFVSLSPALIEYSCLVNVDTLMAFFCLWSVYSALRLFDNFSIGNFVALCVLSGLAVSTKYNCAPIAALPLLLLFIPSRRATFSRLLLAIFLPLISFVAATPYLVSSWALFLQHVRFEVWHYAVAGHVGNEASPGLEQALFYSSWIAKDALGHLIAIGALLGLLALLRAPQKKLVVFIFFPLLYLVLMLCQKVHFPRNMLVMLPFVSILCAHFLRSSVERDMLLWLALPIIFIAEPIVNAFQSRQLAATRHDSRRDAETWITTNRQGLLEVALEGTLQFAPSLRVLPAIAPLKLETRTMLDLYQQGYDWVVVPSAYAAAPELSKLAEFPGNPLSRIVDSPAITIYQINKEAISEVALRDSAEKVHLPLSTEDQQKICGDGVEGYCWISTRASKIEVEPSVEVTKRFPFRTVSLEVMSPWKDQRVEIIAGDQSSSFILPAGTWQTIDSKARVNQLGKAFELIVKIAEIHSPKELGSSEDSRRLGLAIRRGVLTGQPPAGDPSA